MEALEEEVITISLFYAMNSLSIISIKWLFGQSLDLFCEELEF